MALSVRISACLAACLIAILAAPLFARPLSKCRLGNQSDYYSIADETSEDTRKELRLRVLIDAIDDADIAFKGRLTKRWYLSDIQETEVPVILEVYADVTVLKGKMPLATDDGKAYLIREKVCDGGCWLNALPEVLEGRGDEPERVVLALNNTLTNPSEAHDRRSNEVVYSGRIDTLGGPCDPRQINAASAVMLLGSPQEMERLRRAYPPRTVEDKRRDADFIIRRVIGVR